MHIATHRRALASPVPLATESGLDYIETSILMTVKAHRKAIKESHDLPIRISKSTNNVCTHLLVIRSAGVIPKRRYQGQLLPK